MLDNECITIYDEWLKTKGYEFKILIIISMLANTEGVFKSNLKQMSEWLGVKPNTNTNKNIKQAIQKLNERKYLNCKQEGRTFYLSINIKNLRNNTSTQVKKEWVNTFKSYNKDENNNRIDKNISIDWSNILKVFTIFYKKTYILAKQEQIAGYLKIDNQTLKNAVKAIKNCDLGNIVLKTNIQHWTLKQPNGKYYTLYNRVKGIEYLIGINFE